MNSPQAGGNVSQNPFRITLPSSTIVGLIFAAYFLLTIPITFFTFRKIGKPGYTWISAPIISVLFAFGFYLFTADLYNATMARRTTGVLTLAAGDPNAHLVAYSQLFFPHTGSYDIAIPNAESLEQTAILSQLNYYNTGTQTAANSIETTDTVNGVVAENYGVGNLAFRRFYYSEPVPLGGALTGRIERVGTGFSGQITNNTNLSLSNVVVSNVTDFRSYSVGSLAPGQTITIDKSPQTSVPQILNQYQNGYSYQRNGSVTYVPNGAGYPPNTVNGPSPGYQPQVQIQGPIRNIGQPPSYGGANSNSANSGERNDGGSVYLTAAVPSKSLGIQVGVDVSDPNSISLVTTLPLTEKAGAK